MHWGWNLYTREQKCCSGSEKVNVSERDDFPGILFTCQFANSQSSFFSEKVSKMRVTNSFGYVNQPVGVRVCGGLGLIAFSTLTIQVYELNEFLRIRLMLLATIWTEAIENTQGQTVSGPKNVFTLSYHCY